MNGTFWNSTEEALGHFFLGGISFCIYGYGMFLSFAIIDYQDEKPAPEKSPIDILVKDLMCSFLWYLFSTGLIQFISIFTPEYVPLFGNFGYLVSHLLVFISNFFCVSCLLHLYIQHIYVFQADDFNLSSVASMRRKCFLWKFFLTIVAILLSSIFPAREPIMVLLIFKAETYDR